ncbi:hypothetical protein INR49_006015 [Caranx melampygus]|nr:hypothetical protein INR49_006015 [Caranx melampygus]
MHYKLKTNNITACYVFGGKRSRSTRLSGLCQVTGHLYLSNARAANDSAQVSGHKITCVINVTETGGQCPALHGVEYIHIPVSDSPISPLRDHFDDVADKIELVAERGGRTLVHCNAGVSRSAALCMAYLMKHQGATLLEAHRCVKTCRPIVRPNNGFWKQLIRYEMELRGCNSVHMTYSSIGEIPDIYEKEARNMMPVTILISAIPWFFLMLTICASAFLISAILWFFLMLIICASAFLISAIPWFFLMLIICASAFPISAIPWFFLMLIICASAFPISAIPWFFLMLIICASAFPISAIPWFFLMLIICASAILISAIPWFFLMLIICASAFLISAIPWFFRILTICASVFHITFVSIFITIITSRTFGLKGLRLEQGMMGVKGCLMEGGRWGEH